MSAAQRYDVAVIGAGVFGGWTAWHLARRGQRVVLADAYGGGNARSSSGGESRIIRMGYGQDELYTRWSQKSLGQWKKFFAATGQALFQETGVLWLAGKDDSRIRQTKETLKKCSVPFEEMERAALERRYPQVSFEGITRGIFEPHSGVLMARRAVAAVVEDAVKRGVEYQTFSRGPWGAHFPNAAGSFLLRSAWRRCKICASGAAHLAVSGRRNLRNARPGGPRVENRVRQSRGDY